VNRADKCPPTWRTTGAPVASVGAGEGDRRGAGTRRACKAIPPYLTRFPQVSVNPQLSAASLAMACSASEADRAAAPTTAVRSGGPRSCHGKAATACGDLREDPLRGARQASGAGRRQLPRPRRPPSLRRPQRIDPGAGRAAAARSPPRPEQRRDPAGAHRQPARRDGRALAGRRRGQRASRRYQAPVPVRRARLRPARPPGSCGCARSPSRPSTGCSPGSTPTTAPERPSPPAASSPASSASPCATAC